MIYIVINKKGGCGKSTFSNQILSAYLFQKAKAKVDLVEIDDENKDCLTFSSTEIFNGKSLKTRDVEASLDTILSSKKDTIIDVGGNKTSSLFFNEMSLASFTKNKKWFVPLGTGEQENLNALDTYNSIRDIDSEADVIFVLSRARAENEKWEFSSFFGSEFFDSTFAVNNQVDNIKYVSINDDPVLQNVRPFQRTILDFAMIEKDYVEAAINEEDEKKIRKFTYLNRIKKLSIRYIKYLEKDVFRKLDDFLK